MSDDERQPGEDDDTGVRELSDDELDDIAAGGPIQYTGDEGGLG